MVTARTTFAGRRASIDFVNGHPTCVVCGTCKRQRVLAHRAAGRRVVYIGDGESDRYAAGDIVFAKRSLERICLEAGWAFRRWTAFREIDAWLAETIEAWGDGSGVAGAGAARCIARTRLLLRAGGMGRGARGPAAGVLAAAPTSAGTSRSSKRRLNGRSSTKRNRWCSESRLRGLAGPGIAPRPWLSRRSEHWMFQSCPPVDEARPGRYRRGRAARETASVCAPADRSAAASPDDDNAAQIPASANGPGADPRNFGRSRVPSSFSRS